MSTVNAINDAIARACGLPTERLVKLRIDVQADRWPVVLALYVPEGGGELVDVLGSLEFREDLMHVEVDAPKPTTTTPTPP